MIHNSLGCNAVSNASCTAKSVGCNAKQPLAAVTYARTTPQHTRAQCVAAAMRHEIATQQRLQCATTLLHTSANLLCRREMRRQVCGLQCRDATQGCHKHQNTTKTRSCTVCLAAAMHHQIATQQLRLQCRQGAVLPAPSSAWVAMQNSRLRLSQTPEQHQDTLLRSVFSSCNAPLECYTTA
jgi:hypothetical protein